MRAATRVLLVALLAASAVAGPTETAPVVANLPPAAADALESFRGVPWGERCKPTRPDPMPDGWQARVKVEAALACVDATKLAPLLQDADRFVRAVAARAIGLAGSSTNAPALAAALAVEKDKPARVAMIEALGRCGGPDALAAVEAQQTPGVDADISWMVGMARRQLKGQHWDLANLRGEFLEAVGSSRVDLQACKLEYSIVSPK